MDQPGLTTAGLTPEGGELAPNRPRHTLRQIQVMPDESDQLSQLLARYETMDLQQPNESVGPRVEVRTRNIVLVSF